MAVIVEGEEEPSLEEESAHDIGVAEGRAELHEEDAAEAAEAAEISADIAQAAAEANVEVLAEIAEHSARAEEAAASAGLSENAVLEALQAQTVALQSLTETLRSTVSSQPEKVPTEKKPAPKADRAPTARRRGWSSYLGN